MAIPEKVTGIPYIDYAIDDARKGINELLGIKPSDSTEDVIIKEISIKRLNSFNFNHFTLFLVGYNKVK